jgi:hypothetical protein
MIYNERKKQTLEWFAQTGWQSPAVWAVAQRFYPLRASYSYLLHLHRWHYLQRGRDMRGSVVYKLGPKGANWLLRNRAGGSVSPL